MNLKEWAKENDKTLAEAKEMTGLTHWAQKVPESCDEIPEVAEDVVNEEKHEEKYIDTMMTVIETESKEDIKEQFAKAQEVMKMLMKDGTTPEKALAGIRLIGKKCKYIEHEEVLKTLVD